METETSWDVRSFHLSPRLLVLVRNDSDKDKRGGGWREIDTLTICFRGTSGRTSWWIEGGEDGKNWAVISGQYPFLSWERLKGAGVGVTRERQSLVSHGRSLKTQE